MTKILKQAIAALVFSAATAHAAILSPDATGLWYNASESGWGAAITQQGDVLFVALFVYDDQKRPAWFVASSVTDAGNGVFSGTLYRTSGPAFSGTFDPTLVDRQAVGTLSLQYADNGGQGAILRYTVNDVTVTKAIVRQTWRSNATRLPGAYFGGIRLSLAAGTQPAGCPAPPSFLPPGGPIAVSVSDAGTISISGSAGIDTGTLISGVYFQTGQIGLITGIVSSGPIPLPPRLGDVQITNFVISDDGFVGHLRMTINGCSYDGTIGGIRR